MNYPNLDDVDFERAVTTIWYVGMHRKNARCWIYQKTKLEGLLLLYATGEEVEDLALLVKIIEFTILQLVCDEDHNSQDLSIDQIMETDMYHSMDMIRSCQTLSAAMERSSELQVLREKLDNDFKKMEDRFTRYVIGDRHQRINTISVEEKTRMLCARLDRVRSIAETE